MPLYSSHLHLLPCNSNFLSTEVMLPGNVPSLQIQKCPGRMLASSSLDLTSRACMHPHTPGLALLSSLTTISATLFSRFRIPADDVTVAYLVSRQDDRKFVRSIHCLYPVSAAQALHRLVQCETRPSVAHSGNSSSRQVRASVDQQS